MLEVRLHCEALLKLKSLEPVLNLERRESVPQTCQVVVRKPGGLCVLFR